MCLAINAPGGRAAAVTTDWLHSPRPTRLASEPERRAGPAELCPDRPLQLVLITRHRGRIHHLTSQQCGRDSNAFQWCGGQCAMVLKMT